MVHSLQQWRKPALILAILTVLGVLLTHWFAWPLTWPLELRLPVDVEVYWQGAREFWLADDLYDIRYDTTFDNLPFTYPPFGALVFTPLWWIHDLFGLLVTERVFALITLLTTYAVAVFLLRLAGVRDRVWEFVAFAALLVSAPVYFTLNIGQINVVLMALTLFDVALPRSTRHSGVLKYVPLGVLTGIAAAIKLTPLVFGLYFLILWVVTKSPRGLFGMIGGFLGASGLAIIFRRRPPLRTQCLHPCGFGTTPRTWFRSIYHVACCCGASDHRSRSCCLPNPADGSLRAQPSAGCFPGVARCTVVLPRQLVPPLGVAWSVNRRSLANSTPLAGSMGRIRRDIRIIPQFPTLRKQCGAHLAVVDACPRSTLFDLLRSGYCRI